MRRLLPSRSEYCVLMKLCRGLKMLDCAIAVSSCTIDLSICLPF